MDVLNQIIIMLITLGLLIAFHEYGHFWVARRCGVKVLRFSIGFGPALFSWKDKQNTEYTLSLLPLGGYVKMLDEREDEVTEEEKSYAFNNKPVSQRIAIVSAGPIANFILAIVVYWFVFLQGSAGLAPVLFNVSAESVAEKSGLQQGLEIVAIDGEDTSTVQAVAMQLLERMGDSGEIIITARYPDSDPLQEYKLPINQWMGGVEEQVDPLADLGLGFYYSKIEAVIAEVVKNSAADIAGLQKDDRLLQMDGLKIIAWEQWVDYVRARADRTIALTVERNGEISTVDITPKPIKEGGKTIGQVGIRVEVPPVPDELIRYQEYTVLSAWLPALQRTGQMAVFCLQSLKKILLGDISYKQLSGPISIAKVASKSADSGIYSYLSLLALLSVSLGVLNLLPIPVLDGGHILFYLLEWIKGEPVSEKVQVWAFQIGMAIVLSVMVLAVVNDIGRL